MIVSRRYVMASFKRGEIVASLSRVNRSRTRQLCHRLSAAPRWWMSVSFSGGVRVVLITHFHPHMNVSSELTPVNDSIHKVMKLQSLQPFYVSSFFPSPCFIRWLDCSKNLNLKKKSCNKFCYLLEHGIYSGAEIKNTVILLALRQVYSYWSINIRIILKMQTLVPFNITFF